MVQGPTEDPAHESQAPEPQACVQANYPAHEVQRRQGGTGVQYVPNNVPFDGTSAYSVRPVKPYDLGSTALGALVYSHQAHRLMARC